MDLVKGNSHYRIFYILVFILLFILLMETGMSVCQPVAAKPMTQAEKQEQLMNHKITDVNPELVRQKYVALDQEEDVKLVSDIESNTSLDFDSAYVLVAYARKFDIRPSLLLSMIELESNFDQYCVGTHQDRGFLQIIPPTEKWLAEVFGEELNIEYDPDKIFEPDYNIGLGAAYIHLLKEAYGDDINRILSEYNRGPYNLKKYFDANHTYETTYSRSILSREKKYEQFNR